MANTTTDRWNARRDSVSILHHEQTGVWLGIHEPEGGEVVVSHPKADDHCLDYFFNGPPSRIPAQLPDQAADGAREAIAAALEAMEAARPQPEVL